MGSYPRCAPRSGRCEGRQGVVCVRVCLRCAAASLPRSQTRVFVMLVTDVTRRAKKASAVDSPSLHEFPHDRSRRACLFAAVTTQCVRRVIVFSIFRPHRGKK
eukprot:COSAG01_NODE_3152_length_6498_cov_17.406470_4_plen_103_part_00